MSPSRRRVLQAAALAALIVAVEPSLRRRILVLGGTRFVGRAIVEAALARGHVLTLFNRGQTNPGLFPAAETILGDREGDHRELRGRRWDVVVDTSGVEPGHVERACEVLAGAVDRYVYLSSTAAYTRDMDAFDEEHPVRAVPVTGARSYNEKKARGEGIVEARFGARKIVVRPAVLVGPHDPLHRFVRWPLRARVGGEVIAPGSPEDPLPLADVRDLAVWLISQVEGAATGIFNVAGPPFNMQDLVAAAQRYGALEPVWIDRAWLAERRVDFDSLPSLHVSGYQAMRSARAEAAGIRFRGLAASMADALAWYDAQPASPHVKLGLSRAREDALLGEWRARSPRTSG